MPTSKFSRTIPPPDFLVNRCILYRWAGSGWCVGLVMARHRQRYIRHRTPKSNGRRMPLNSWKSFLRCLITFKHCSTSTPVWFDRTLLADRHGRVPVEWARVCSKPRKPDLSRLHPDHAPTQDHVIISTPLVPGKQCLSKRVRASVLACVCLYNHAHATEY